MSFASLDYTLQIFICSVIPDRYTGNVNNIEPLTVIKYKMFSKQACVPTNSQNIGYQRNNSWIYKKSQHLFFYSLLPHLKGTPDLVPNKQIPMHLLFIHVSDLLRITFIA